MGEHINLDEMMDEIMGRMEDMMQELIGDQVICAVQDGEWRHLHGTEIASVRTPSRDTCTAPASLPPAMRLLVWQGMPISSASSNAIRYSSLS